jgi:hypothetical protein
MDVFSKEFFSSSKAEAYAMEEIEKGNDASIWKYLNGRISVLVQERNEAGTEVKP